MNQILVTDKLYVTPKLKKKKKIYRAEFFISMILVFVFAGWYVCSEVEKNAKEDISHEILSESQNIEIANVEDMEEEPLVVSFNDQNEIIEEEGSEPTVPATTSASYTDAKGTTYTYESILSIPKIGIEYPVLSETNDELLKISLNKFWGGEPNSVGNYCIVGHNYRSGRMFGKLSSIYNGDKVYLKDLSGETVEYEVYDRFIVYPDDVSCTSQRTNGLREMTLITCTNQGKQRLIIKCRAV